MGVTVVNFDEAETELTGSGALCRTLRRRHVAFNAFLRSFGETHGYGLRATIAHIFEPGGAARETPGDVAAQPILRRHRPAVERDDYVVWPQAHARRGRSRFDVLDQRTPGTREL